VTKPKYATAAERNAALSANAKKQMRAQWEQQRQQSGQELGYYGCHRRVRKARGRAGDLACTDCGLPAMHWAHIHGTDPSDPQNYQPMCQRCHWAYDGVGTRVVQAKGPDGRRALALKAWSRRSPEARREIFLKGWATRRASQEAAARASSAGPLDGAG